MKIAVFTHSLRSCWNHGNAHFLRGVVRALVADGHSVSAWEPDDGWSAANLRADHGDAALRAWQEAYPELPVRLYDTAAFDAAATCDGADLVLVHEWSDPTVVAAIGRLRARGARFTALFHDTHHRAVSEPDAMRGVALDGYDGVLAFGEALSAIYRGWGWGRNVFTWHEAADLTRFRPPAQQPPRDGIVWIGNWGDGERTAELETFLLTPAREAGLALDVHGVRYPPEARALLARHGARYRGWIANTEAPGVFARHLATVHVPRRFYAAMLPGIPTIRVFEALACGIPLLCAPWEDREGLFRPGTDYLVARDGDEATGHLRALATDPELRHSLAQAGLATITARHSCAHRAHELVAIAARFGVSERAVA